jgi:hypothetical protein
VEVRDNWPQNGCFLSVRLRSVALVSRSAENHQRPFVGFPGGILGEGVGAEFLAPSYAPVPSRKQTRSRSGDRHGGCDVEVHARPAALRVRSSGAVLCVEDARGESSAAVPHAPALARRCPLAHHSSARRDEATRGASATVGRLPRHSPNLPLFDAACAKAIVGRSLGRYRPQHRCPPTRSRGPSPRSHGGSADISLHSVHLDELEWQMKIAVIILNPTFLVFIQLVAR